MSDSPSTPPKPKSGSLRDRIAAFETKAVNPSSERGPLPRPRPVGFANWKPKQSSPPTSPEALTESSAGIKSPQNVESAPRSGSGSMNAADAKESIARAGGSLKERMAALQGRGGFGAPVSPSIPTPRQWAPPLQAVTQPALGEDDDGQNQLQEGIDEEVEGGPVKSNPPSIKSPQLVPKSPPPIVRSPPSAVENDASGVSEEVKESCEYDEGAQDGSVLADEGEEERQRRAAIAARMAKLGGARIGMGPAVYGHAAPIKKPTSPSAASLEPQVPQVQSSQVGEEASTADDDTSPRPPPAMPMAAVPKRTAPPRRKSAKTTATGMVTSHEASSVFTTTDASAAILAAQDSLPNNPPVVDVTAQIIEPIETHGTAEVLEEESKPAEESPAKEKQENEEDEELRKQHVTEKLAKMGGINPFVYIPVRRPSVGSIASAEGAAPSQPVPIEKPASPDSPHPVYADKLPMLRRASGGSTKSFDFSSGIDVGRRTSVGSVTSGKSTSEVAGVGRRTSVGSVKSVPKQEGIQEVQEIVEELENIGLEDVTGVQSPTQAKMKQLISAKDERNAHNPHEDKIDDEHIQSDERTSDDEDNDAAPQPLPRLSPVTLPSSQQEDIRRQVDNDVILGVVHPSPPRSPSAPLSSTIIGDATQRTEKPLSPGISPTSRDPSVHRDRLSGPAPPRRVVPQTPEQSACDLDGQNASTDEADSMGANEEETSSDLASSTLFVPPPAMADLALRSNDEESDLPLHVPPPSNSGRFVAEEKERGRAYEDTDDESNTSDVALPVRLNVASDDDAREVVELKQPLPLGSAPLVSIHTASAEKAGSDCDDDLPHEQEHERGEEHKMEESIHARPRSDDLSQSIYSAAERLVNEIPFFVPPRSSEGSVIRHVPMRSVPVRLFISSPPSSSSSSSQPRQQYYEDEEKEVLDEDEGDPIDPTFHSPIRRTHWGEHAFTKGMTEASSELFVPSSTTLRAPPSAALSPPASSSIVTAELKESIKIEEEEESKKQTIAERMARLGGIKFGATPDLGKNPSVPSSRKVLSDESTDVVVGEGQGDVPVHEKQLTQEHVRGSDDQDNEGENEEEERLRKERITAKLAGMGGMRIGMMPMAMPPRQSHVLDSSQPQNVSTSTTTPLPKAPVMTKRSDASESGTSEDGVKVEVEESEIEEVGYEEARGDSEEDSGEEIPPPPPPRTFMRQETGGLVSSGATSILAASPMTRPPVPVPGPFKRASVQSTGSKKTQQPVQAQPSEYVLVDEPQMMKAGVEDDAPPLPPTRPPHQVPSHTRTTASLADSISSQWELPGVPSSSLSGDLSASWSDALIYERQLTPPPLLPPHKNAPVPIPPPVVSPVSPSMNVLRLSSDELIAVWGRVGVQICEVATTMHDHSKKKLIGDGTYRGFVDTVLREVPNAAKPESKQFPYGYLVYLQNGGQVQKRASEIMPGDVVEIVDARFKGHKGLGGYQQFVGAGVEGGEGGGPVVGVISELEPKKSKLRVFQANQHVSQQTVESVSYRLDDLKSGLVKVYRVLEAQ